MCVEARYARINWMAHIVPVAESAYTTFHRQLCDAHLQDMYTSRLSEDATSGLLDVPTKEWWSDSITFSFGNRSVPVEAVVRVPGRAACLSEAQASLVISQAVSGAITAVIYPPSSDVSKPQKEYYLVGLELDPSAVSEAWLLGLLELTYEVDVFCGAHIFPNRRGGRLMAKLRAKDAVLSEGGSRLWVWLRYMFSATTGVLRLYGIGKPVP